WCGESPRSVRERSRCWSCVVEMTDVGERSGEVARDSGVERDSVKRGVSEEVKSSMLFSELVRMHRLAAAAFVELISGEVLLPLTEWFVRLTKTSIERRRLVDSWFEKSLDTSESAVLSKML